MERASPRPRLHIYFGADDFSLKQALKSLQAELGIEDSSLGASYLDAEGLILGQLTSVCDTLPFLSPCRMVVVRGLLARWGEEAPRRARVPPAAQDSGRGREWARLKGYVAQMPPTTTLVLVDGPLSRGNPGLVELKPLAVVKEFPLLRGLQLHRWVQEQVASAGGRISPGAVRLLVDLVGGNLWSQKQEIEKLCLFAGQRVIGEAEVRLLVAQAREASIFAMVDALMEGNIPQAMRLLGRLRVEGLATSYIMAMLGRQLRLVAQAQDLLSQGVPESEVARRLGLTSDYALGKVIAQARSRPAEAIRRGYRVLLEGDVAIKTGQLGEELALELTVAEAGRWG